jgi:structural maintenance of chromosome 2
MLEETAGTALYNQKKRESQNLMAKKEEKLKEIGNLIKDEINPQMERLKAEREQFMLWRS